MAELGIDILDAMSLDEATDYLMHYGTKYHSGRYPYGSGEDPYQHDDLYDRVKEMEAKGYSQLQMAEELGISTTMLRTQYSIETNRRKAEAYEKAKKLRESGMSYRKIAASPEMANTDYAGKESSIRSLLASTAKKKVSSQEALVNLLRDEVDKKGMVDVGKGVDIQLGVNKEQMRKALQALRVEGYEVLTGSVHTGPDRETVLQALAKPGTPQKDIYDYEKVKNIGEDYYSPDQGLSFKKAFQYPASMDSKRLQIRYAEDGGTAKDGVVELRRGVKDLDLGGANYAQVRILVDGTHYIKGMAVYADDLPEGIDARFNVKYTREEKPTVHDALKKIKNDPDNPFGSLIKEHGGQSTYIDDDGNEKLSLINKRSEAGDWGEWGKNLPTQFLAKQSKGLILQQLDAAKTLHEDEFNDIMEMTNPTVKQVFLEDYAKSMDTAAVHMRGAALPRQQFQVILPLTTLKDNEVYAPNYNDGEELALVRFPHSGTFEIPVVRVNNRNREGIDILGSNPADAIGINSKVAARLSGADFDGDTVMCLPLSESKNKIISRPLLEGLVGFDSKMEEMYGADYITEDNKGNKHYFRNGKEFKHMTNTNQEMGKISNLITDMTVIGATDDELARAVRHSMVVIDAEKHGYDYKQSYIDNGIEELKKKYQRHVDADGNEKYGGASTIFSQASGKARLDEKRYGAPRIDPETGELIFKSHVETYDTVMIKKPGDKKYTVATGDDRKEYYRKKAAGEDISEYKVKVNKRQTVIPKMQATNDAHTLSNGYYKEEIYADYANYLKSLANRARLESLHTGRIEVSKKAKETFAEEVNSLDAKLRAVQMNAPRERRAQMMTESEIEAKKKADLDLTDKEIGKLRQQALTRNRALYGSNRKDLEIEITDKEWQAIQSGAISSTRLKEIIRYADKDKVRELSSPTVNHELPQAKINRIKNLASNHYTNAQIAEMLGISTKTVSKYISQKEE